MFKVKIKFKSFSERIEDSLSIFKKTLSELDDIKYDIENENKDTEEFIKSLTASIEENNNYLASVNNLRNNINRIISPEDEGRTDN